MSIATSNERRTIRPKYSTGRTLIERTSHTYIICRVSNKEVVTTDGPAPVSARVVLTVSAEATR
jgi:hypothetical protein